MSQRIYDKFVTQLQTSILVSTRSLAAVTSPPHSQRCGSSRVSAVRFLSDHVMTWSSSAWSSSTLCLYLLWKLKSSTGAVWDPAPKRHSRAMSHSAWLFWTRNKTLPDHNPGGLLGIVVFISWLQRAVLGEATAGGEASSEASCRSPALVVLSVTDEKLECLYSRDTDRAREVDNMG